MVNVNAEDDSRGANTEAWEELEGPSVGGAAICPVSILGSGGSGLRMMGSAEPSRLGDADWSDLAILQDASCSIDSGSRL